MVLFLWLFYEFEITSVKYSNPGGQSNKGGVAGIHSGPAGSAAWLYSGWCWIGKPSRLALEQPGVLTELLTRGPG